MCSDQYDTGDANVRLTRFSDNFPLEWLEALEQVSERARVATVRPGDDALRLARESG